MRRHPYFGGLILGTIGSRPTRSRIYPAIRIEQKAHLSKPVAQIQSRFVPRELLMVQGGLSLGKGQFRVSQLRLERALRVAGRLQLVGLLPARVCGRLQLASEVLEARLRLGQGVLRPRMSRVGVSQLRLDGPLRLLRPVQLAGKVFGARLRAREGILPARLGRVCVRKLRLHRLLRLAGCLQFAGLSRNSRFRVAQLRSECRLRRVGFLRLSRLLLQRVVGRL